MPALIWRVTALLATTLTNFAMNSPEKIMFKNRLKDFCVQLLKERLKTTTDLITAAQDSANNEGKSSAGDKYETGRAMGHLQKEMYQQQAEKIRHELLIANATDTVLNPGIIKQGSAIITDDLVIFICVGLGKKIIEGKTVLFVSGGSPLFKLLYSRKPADSIVIDRKQSVIREIY